MTGYTTIIILTLIGFIALAVVLLVPVYLFIRREEKAGEKWTETVERRRRERASVNGSQRASESQP